MESNTATEAFESAEGAPKLENTGLGIEVSDRFLGKKWEIEIFIAEVS